ncbi:unnamed protein product [Gulo gulo]|uniref:Uncharacterized protein n=1 Tax=Gulo gulo TaxID=48420 RepID=A0A9X9LKK7_GULGU|nr:unnamed protein product [Gulo gulo]
MPLCIPKESAISAVRARQKLGSGRPVPAERWRARGEHQREGEQQQESSGRTGRFKGRLWRGRHQRGEKGRGPGISSEVRRVGGARGGSTGAWKRRDAHREEGVLSEGCGLGGSRGEGTTAPRHHGRRTVPPERLGAAPL